MKGTTMKDQPIQRNALDQTQTYKLTKLIDGLDTLQFISHQKLADHCCGVLEFTVTKHNVKGVLNVLGKETAYEQARSRKANAQTDVQSLAAALVTLYNRLGEPVPLDIVRLTK